MKKGVENERGNTTLLLFRVEKVKKYYGRLNLYFCQYYFYYTHYALGTWNYMAEENAYFL